MVNYMIIAIWTQCEPDLTYIKIDELTLTQDMRVKCLCIRKCLAWKDFKKLLLAV